jgi:hypothetical protein
MVVFVPLVGTGAVVGAHMASHLARGLYMSLGRGRSMPRKLGAPVLTLQGLGEEKIVPDRVQGSGALMGARARRKPSLSLERFNS